MIVGTGAQNTARAVALARHGATVGAAGLMVIPRVLSRGVSPVAQFSSLQRHFGRRSVTAVSNLQQSLLWL